MAKKSKKKIKAKNNKEKKKSSKDKKSEEQNAQSKFVEYNILQRQTQQLTQELEAITSTIENLETSKSTLKSIDKEDKSDIMVPIGGNVYLKATLKDNENALTGVGSDIIMEKPISDAVDTIDEQIEDLENASGQIEGGLEKYKKKMSELEPELKKLQAQMQKNAPGKQ